MKHVVVAFILIAGCKEETTQPLRIAAASDLTEAFGALTAQFDKDAKITFGSSGLLAKQIAEGAPFDLFASANAQFVNDAVKSGACDGATVKTYARGRLALMGNVSIDQLPSVRRIAIANPEHAPYGKAAQQALTKLGTWDSLKPQLVFTENVRQAVQFADTGNVEVALVAWSNVIDRDGGVTLVDESLHEPIEQTLVVCRHGRNAEAARRFVQFLESEPARATMLRYGFR
ncbi:MAG: molybdate ABC transporter substrate-binding protein [Archangium sp.]